MRWADAIMMVVRDQGQYGALSSIPLLLKMARKQGGPCTQRSELDLIHTRACFRP